MKEKQVKLFGDIVIFDKRFKGISRDIQKNIVSFIHVSAEELKKMKHENGTIKLLSTGLFTGYTTKELASNYINKGEVITIPTGGTANIKYHNGEFVDSGNILCVSKYRDIDLKFVYYALLYNKDYIESCYKGTGIKHPYMPDIWNIPIPIPSITEQQSIVIYINSQFAKIDAIKANAEKQLQEAKTLFQNALKDLLTPKEGWNRKIMSDICTLSQGLAINSKTRSLIVEKSSIPLLRIKDMKNGTKEIFIDDIRYPKSCLAIPEDIIYTRTGTLGLVFTGQYGIVHNNCFKINLNTSEVNKSFYMYYIQEGHFRNNIIKEAEKSVQADITHCLFKKQIISYPNKIEQNIITEKLDDLLHKVTQLQSNFSQTITLCEDLKKSLLKDIFS